VISDGDVQLGESGAIIAYIIAKYGQGRLSLGPDSPDFADYLFWFHFANGSLMPGAMVDLVLTLLGASGSDNAIVLALRDRVDRSFAMIEQRLGSTAYFAGASFSAADIIMLFPLTTMRAFVPRDLSPFPNILAYLQRIGQRPAFQRAMAKADPGFAPMLS
jgi:glutathione S-transferase